MSAHVKPKGVDKTQKKGINSLSHKNHNYDRKCASFPLLSSNRFSRTLSINDRKRKSSSRLYYFSRWSLESAPPPPEKERETKRGSLVGGIRFLIHRAKSTNTKLFFRLAKNDSSENENENESKVGITTKRTMPTPARVMVVSGDGKDGIFIRE